MSKMGECISAILYEGAADKTSSTFGDLPAVVPEQYNVTACICSSIRGRELIFRLTSRSTHYSGTHSSRIALKDLLQQYRYLVSIKCLSPPIISRFSSPPFRHPFPRNSSGCQSRSRTVPRTLDQRKIVA